MRLSRVRNITQGTVELHPYGKVLGPMESTVLAEPLSEQVRWLPGQRLVKIEPIPEQSATERPADHRRQKATKKGEGQ